MLEVAAAEAVKTVAVAVAGAAVTGAGNLFQLLWRRLRVKPGSQLDRETLTRLIIEAAEADPSFAQELYDAVSEVSEGTGQSGLLPPSVFFDRDEQRARFGESGFWLIAGVRGSGKTALMAQLAAETQFGRNAYIDLDGYREGNAVHLAEAQRSVLRQLGVQLRASSELELNQQYQSALIRQRFVLMIDNVVNRAEATALAYPWPRSLVLMTARRFTQDLRTLPFTGAFTLDGLDKSGAWEMLASRVGEEVLAAEPEAAWELLNRCDRMPEAIIQVGARLSYRQDEPEAVAEVLVELQNATGGASVVDRCVAQTFAELPAAIVRGAVSLGVHPGPDFMRAAARVLASDEVIEALTEACLLVKTPGGRLALSQPARRHAAGLFGPSGTDEAAFEKVLAYYSESAIAADLSTGDRVRLYAVPEGVEPMRKAPIDWLEAESAVLANLVEQASLRQRHVAVTQFCGALEVLLNNRGHHQLVLSAMGHGANSAQMLGEPALTARMHAMQGRILMLLHRFDRATAALATAREIVAHVDNPVLQASVLEFSARLEEDKAGAAPVADYDHAIALSHEAIAIDRRAGSVAGLGIHLRMLANVLVKAERPAEALPLLEEAVMNTLIARNHSRIHTVRAKAFAALGEVDQAEAEIALSRGEASGATQYDIELAELEATIALRRSDVERAREIWGTLAAVHMQNGHPRFDYYQRQLSLLPAPPR